MMTLKRFMELHPEIKEIKYNGIELVYYYQEYGVPMEQMVKQEFVSESAVAKDMDELERGLGIINLNYKLDRSQMLADSAGELADQRMRRIQFELLPELEKAQSEIQRLKKLLRDSCKDERSRCRVCGSNLSYNVAVHYCDCLYNV